MGLEAWRRNETTRIHNSNADEATKKAALKQLLHKETKLLQTVDRLKIQAHAINRDAKTQQMLEAMAKPKVWAQTDGEATTVHTPFTTRAKELMICTTVCVCLCSPSMNGLTYFCMSNG